jgi:hypothetical protein
MPAQFCFCLLSSNRKQQILSRSPLGCVGLLTHSRGQHCLAPAIVVCFVDADIGLGYNTNVTSDPTATVLCSLSGRIAVRAAFRQPLQQQHLLLPSCVRKRVHIVGMQKMSGFGYAVRAGRTLRSAAVCASPVTHATSGLKTVSKREGAVRAALTLADGAEKPRLGSSSASSRLYFPPMSTCGDLVCQAPHATRAVTFDLPGESHVVLEAFGAGLEGSSAYLPLRMQMHNDVAIAGHQDTFFCAATSVYAAHGALGFHDAHGGSGPGALHSASLAFDQTPTNKQAQHSWATCTEGPLMQQGASKGA